MLLNHQQMEKLMINVESNAQSFNSSPPVNAKLWAAFVVAQAEIDGVVKNRDNPYFNSRYADLAAIIEVVRASFKKHELGFTQDVMSDDTSVTCITTIVHVSGERHKFEPYRLPVAQKTPQAFGSATTYSRRYSLQAAAGIACEEDDDGNEGSRGATAVRPEPPVNRPVRQEEDARPLPPPRQEPVREPGADMEAPPQPPGRPAPITFRFGKSKGSTSHTVTDNTLAWYLKCARESAADPSKARFAAANRQEVSTLEAEANWRGLDR